MLWIDIETFSDIDIKAGVHKYAEHAELLLISYAIDEAPARVVDVANNDELPTDLLDAINDSSVTVCAHNSHFDRTVLKRFYPALADPSRWIDTMILAYSVGLPGSLHDLCDFFRLPTDKAKDEDGRRLIQLFCKPRPATCKTRRETKLTRPDDWNRFVNYARLDVEAMRALHKLIPHWNDTPSMWNEWHYDQLINDRGMYIDTELVQGAIEACNTAKIDCDNVVKTLTNGVANTVGECEKIIKFFCDNYNIRLPDLQRSTLEHRLADDTLPEPVRAVIQARLSASKASVKKYDALARSTSSDGRLRGCLQFMGAVRTGRFTGRVFQPQNLARGSLKPAEVERGIAALKTGTANILYDDVHSLASSCLRGAICAPAGRKLCVADLSNIEGRVLAWLAGEDWKLQAFRDFDAGQGVDLYKATYGRTFGVNPSDVTKAQRQIGKVLELALGYSGGASAFLTFAKNFNLDLNELAEHTRRAIDPEIYASASDSYEWYQRNGAAAGIERDVFIACESIKRAWRAAHPATVKLWSDVANACTSCLRGETKSVDLLHVTIGVHRGFLAVRLPSGRYIAYPIAKLPEDNEMATFTYYGPYQQAPGWGRIRTYGGKLVENITQATARDVLTSAMANIEREGYKIILSVHDEYITETLDTKDYSHERLAQMMATAPAWAEGLPLAAAGFESYRYKKD